MGGDRYDLDEPTPIEQVSIHAPAWGATVRSRISFTSLSFQSTPPRGGRLLEDNAQRQDLPVSIHAPAWGATIARVVHKTVKVVSIHAPAWGATPLRHAIRCRLDVSIHAPAWGATIETGRETAAPIIVSIHAPAWGATDLAVDDRVDCVFQSTPPRGGRPVKEFIRAAVLEFQSTPPRGGRRLRIRKAVSP